MSLSPSELAERGQDFRDGIEGHIRDYGHSVVAVFPTKPEDGATFCYTIGRAERGKAELFISGVRGEVGQVLLNYAAAEIDGWEKNDVERGDTLTETANLPIRIGSVSKSRQEEYLCQAVYRGERLGYPVGAVQLVLCDSDGRFPGDPEFNVAQMQGQVCMAADNKWDFDQADEGHIRS